MTTLPFSLVRFIGIKNSSEINIKYPSSLSIGLLNTSEYPHKARLAVKHFESISVLRSTYWLTILQDIDDSNFEFNTSA